MIPSPAAGAVDCNAATTPVASPIATMISAAVAASERSHADLPRDSMIFPGDTATKGTTARYCRGEVSVVADSAARVVASGGVELAVREFGDRDGPVIVFVHGYPDTKEMWDQVLARLPERFHLIAYDVRGAGASDRPRGAAAYDFQRLG